MDPILNVYFRDTRVAKVAGVTSFTPEEVVSTILDGYYRDIFALDAVATGLHFVGLGAGGDGATIEVPALLSGGIVPDGDATVVRGNSSSESAITVSGFKIAVSDEISHEPLRQVSYQESYWAFPVSKDGVSGFAYFRKSVVDGWGPADDNADDD
jgi:hypothetical protein